jgi:large subunit ribosomal protein L30
MAEAKQPKAAKVAKPKKEKRAVAQPMAKPPKAAKASGAKVNVQLVRSGIGTPKDQRATLKGLGLKRLNQQRELVDTPAVRGMLTKVRHLVSVNGQPAA